MQVLMRVQRTGDASCPGLGSCNPTMPQLTEA
jgi:hypothetical protein